LAVLDVAKAVALEDGHGKADLARVLDSRMACAGSMDQLMNACTLAAFSLVTTAVKSVASFSYTSLGHDLDAEARGQLLHLLLARLCQNRCCWREQTDLGNAHLFHLLEDAAGSVAVVGRHLEHVAGHRIHDGLSRGTGQEDGLALLGDGLDFQGFAAGGRTDDGENLVFLNELLGKRDRFFGAAARVFDNQLDLIAGQPTLLLVS